MYFFMMLRFHLLSEFDNGKRSCRKRLADHNRRRRKSNNQRVTSSSAASLSSENTDSSPSQNIISNISFLFYIITNFNIFFQSRQWLRFFHCEFFFFFLWW